MARGRAGLSLSSSSATGPAQHRCRPGGPVALGVGAHGRGPLGTRPRRHPWGQVGAAGRTEWRREGPGAIVKEGEASERGRRARTAWHASYVAVVGFPCCCRAGADCGPRRPVELGLQVHLARQGLVLPAVVLSLLELELGDLGIQPAAGARSTQGPPMDHGVDYIASKSSLRIHNVSFELERVWQDVLRFNLRAGRLRQSGCV